MHCGFYSVSDQARWPRDHTRGWWHSPSWALLLPEGRASCPRRLLGGTKGVVISGGSSSALCGTTISVLSPGSPGPPSAHSSRASSPLFDSGLHLNGSSSHTVSRLLLAFHLGDSRSPQTVWAGLESTPCPGISGHFGGGRHMWGRNLVGPLLCWRLSAVGCVRSQCMQLSEQAGRILLRSEEPCL